MNNVSAEQPEEEYQREQAEQREKHREMMARRENAKLLDSITEEDGFDALRVAQLKDILTENFVDFSLCIVSAGSCSSVGGALFAARAVPPVRYRL